MSGSDGSEPARPRLVAGYERLLRCRQWRLTAGVRSESRSWSARRRCPNGSRGRLRASTRWRSATSRRSSAPREPGRRPPPPWGYRLYERLDAWVFGRASAMRDARLPDAGRTAQPSPGRPPDVVVSFLPTARPKWPGPEPRHGVWTIVPADVCEHRSDPCRFWDVCLRHATTATAIAAIRRPPPAGARPGVGPHRSALRDTHPRRRGMGVGAPRGEHAQGDPSRRSARRRGSRAQ